ncbi:ABC transporter permease [Pendulispora rubella]|uniref:ABC transporter permease n=1 Tax=Pendulispora rubella TaxID=2741070 RepID=A0ABZ2LDI6_9BACT
MRKEPPAPSSGGPPSSMLAPGAGMRAAMARLRQSRLAYAGAIVLAFFALLAVVADLVASEFPMLCRVSGKTYILPNVTHPPELAGFVEARASGQMAAEDWAFGPLVPFGAAQESKGDALLPPFARRAHPLGTDGRGRDVLARVIHGTRTSFGVALFAVVAFLAVGSVLGALGGFLGGVVDGLVSRTIEILSSFPTLVLVLVVQALLPHPTRTTLFVAIALARWPEIARLVRAEVLVVVSNDYVTAARALGASPWRVLLRHIIPNARAPIVVAAMFGIAQVVLIEASLSFLRVGVPPGTASWGEMLSELRDYSGAWWLLVVPGLAVFAVVSSLNLVGEALRDTLDPRLRV